MAETPPPEPTDPAALPEPTGRPWSQPGGGRQSSFRVALYTLLVVLLGLLAYVVAATGRVGSRMAEGERPAGFPTEGGNVTVIQK